MGKSGKISYSHLMQAYLKKHSAGFAEHSLKVQLTRDKKKIVLDFTVQKRMNTPWHTNPVFSSDWSKNWGLWNNDVVEAFLQLRDDPLDLKAPYLEVQVSPLNQPFALIITEPRKSFHAPKVLDFSTQVSLEGKIWRAQLQVELPEELKGKKLFGGFFACLSHEPREFYALEPNPEQQPDFHRPELFLPLDD